MVENLKNWFKSDAGRNFKKRLSVALIVGVAVPTILEISGVDLTGIGQHLTGLLSPNKSDEATNTDENVE